MHALSFLSFFSFDRLQINKTRRRARHCPRSSQANVHIWEFLDNLKNLFLDRVKNSTD